MRGFLLLLVIGGLLAAQDSPTIEVPVRLVIAPTAVTNLSGRFLNGLRERDFNLLDNGLPQTVAIDDVAHRRISLVIVVQNNKAGQSVRDRIRTIGSIVDALIMGESGEAAIMTFSDKPRTVLPFTSDGEKIRRALRRLDYLNGKTQVAEGALAGIEMLKDRPVNRRRVLLLISEARDGGSGPKLREVVREAELHNITIYSLNIRHFSDSESAGNGMTASIDLKARISDLYSGVKNAISGNPLAVLTEYTGGHQYSFHQQHALEEALTNMGEELHGEYLLSYTPDHPTLGYHSIHVEVSKRDALVRSRPGYWIQNPTEQ
ncbi:MAG TPA: VWA domain-containing protein [Bryobacteraceae bacterium]|nr:VWA domain-containing protein [Bryobacteraceae bacterium]